jgi:superfamily I DNA/RNA helicase
MDLTLLDGHLCLIKDERSNLGWRIIAELNRFKSGIENAIKNALENNSRLMDHLPTDFIQEHYSKLQLLRMLLTNKSNLKEEERLSLENYFGISCDEISTVKNKSELDFDETFEGVDKSNTKPLVRLTTYNGCKGLSAGNVFVVGLEQPTDQSKKQPSFNEICQFVVALTRTRKQCHLITVNNFSGKFQRPSIFFDWIPSAMMKDVCVNKEYFDE